MSAAAYQSESDIIDQFRAAMFDAGVPFRGSIKADADKLTRFTVDGDKTKSMTGWYILHTDGVPAGEFGCWKRGVSNTWCAKKPNEITPDERAAIEARREADKAKRLADEKARHDEAAEQASIVWDAAAECADHPYLERKGVLSHGLRVGRWTRVSEETGEIWLDIPDALLVPIRQGKKIVSLQAIFHSKENKSGRDKDFLSGGKKRGCFFSIGKPDPKATHPVIVICEGYATGATIHEALGLPCVVAFDSGNLQPVAEGLRTAFPTAKIVIAADNDQFTLKPMPNPGLHFATAAAKAVVGVVVVPEFSSLESKPTDFNDLAALDGNSAVVRQFDAVLNAPKPSPVHADAVPAKPAANDNKTPAEPPADEVAEKESGFTILGYDRDSIYIFPHEAKQIKELAKGDLTENGLLSLAPIEYWESYFPKAKARYDKTNAVDWLFRTAYRKGVFNPDRIRGRGAWRDTERVVFHLGDRLHVDGAYRGITELRSKYIYQAERPYPRFDHVEPLASDEGEELLALARQFRWRVPASAALVLGWCALAPVCGALRWRPHVWITGGAGSGKSTILEEFVNRLIGNVSVYAQGNSTEAGLRQEIRGDAVPVLFDESEQNTERETQRMQAVLALIRQSSSESGARTFKGTTGGKVTPYHIRSMFCLASIQVGIQHQADRERLTVLSLREKDTSAGAGDNWTRMQNGLYRISRDPDFSLRMLHRVVGMLPVVLETIEIFVKAAAEYFGNQRTGDQYGTLLAGAWSLTSTRIPTVSEASDWINGYDWEEYTEPAKVNESERALQALMDARIRTVHGSEYTVYELLDRLAFLSGLPRQNDSDPACNMDLRDAQAALQRHGMKVVKGQLMIANTSDALVKLVAGTAYAADLRGLICRLPEVSDRQAVASINGKSGRCIAIPLASLV